MTGSTALWRVSSFGNTYRWRLFYVEQFNLEDESRIGRDITAGATGTVGQFRRADQFGLAADFHHLYPFGPAGDYLGEGKADGLMTLVGAIELLAVRQGAAIVDLDSVDGSRRLALAILDGSVDQSGCGLHGAFFLGGLGDGIVGCGKGRNRDN